MCLTGKSGKPAGHPTLPPTMKLEELHSSIKQIRKFFGKLQWVVSANSKLCFNSPREGTPMLYTPFPSSATETHNLCSLLLPVTWAKPSPPWPCTSWRAGLKPHFSFFSAGQLCTAEQVCQIHFRYITLPNPLHTTSVLHRMRSEI